MLRFCSDSVPMPTGRYGFLSIPLPPPARFATVLATSSRLIPFACGRFATSLL
jgi:hypothetical protein